MKNLPELTPEEVERYARHILLRDIGSPGQRKLKGASVAVVGAGGLGAPLLLYLAAAGVGRLKIVDDDTVSLSNLQRQILFADEDVGSGKAALAAEAVRRLNPNIVCAVEAVRLTSLNARELIADCDVVADGSDNFDTRYLVSDACFYARKPLVTAAVGQFDGSLTTLRPFETAPDGTPNPTYRCLFPQKPPPGAVPTCAEAGVLGALTGMVGALMALEVIREIVGFGRSMVGRLALFDLAAMRFETLNYGWDEDNPLNGKDASLAPSKRSEGAERGA
jgi:adenylyltransferase/sulfurtransferase